MILTRWWRWARSCSWSAVRPTVDRAAVSACPGPAGSVHSAALSARASPGAELLLGALSGPVVEVGRSCCLERCPAHRGPTRESSFACVPYLQAGGSAPGVFELLSLTLCLKNVENPSCVKTAVLTQLEGSVVSKAVKERRLFTARFGRDLVDIFHKFLFFVSQVNDNKAEMGAVIPPAVASTPQRYQVTRCGVRLPARAVSSYPQRRARHVTARFLTHRLRLSPGGPAIACGFCPASRQGGASSSPAAFARRVDEAC